MQSRRAARHRSRASRDTSRGDKRVAVYGRSNQETQAALHLLVQGPDRLLATEATATLLLDWVWQYGVYPVDETRTRLVSRSSVRAQALWARVLTHAIEPAGFLMTRRMQLGLKQRAETLRAAHTGETRANQRPAA
jgi:hypothetical protein